MRGMKGRHILLGAVSAIAAGLPAASRAQGPALLPPIKIILVGDSTTSQQTGWGGAFCDQHVVGTVACVALGRGGRSTKTYRAEGTWQILLNELKVPGYAQRLVLITFGSNDKNVDPAIGTRIDTEFPANLTRFVAEVRAAGGQPILVTPLATRHFAAGRLADTLVPWAAQVRAVAAKLVVPLLDLNRASEEAYQRLGAVGALGLEVHTPTAPELAAARAGTTLPARLPASVVGPADDPRRSYQADYIHLNPRGAALVAGMVAGLLVEVAPVTHGSVFP